MRVTTSDGSLDEDQPGARATARQARIARGEVASSAAPRAPSYNSELRRVRITTDYITAPRKRKRNPRTAGGPRRIRSEFDAGRWQACERLDQRRHRAPKSPAITDAAGVLRDHAASIAARQAAGAPRVRSRPATSGTRRRPRPAPDRRLKAGRSHRARAPPSPVAKSRTGAQRDVRLVIGPANAAADLHGVAARLGGIRAGDRPPLKLQPEQGVNHLRAPAVPRTHVAGPSKLLVRDVGVAGHAPAAGRGCRESAPTASWPRSRAGPGRSAMSTSRVRRARVNG